MPRIDGGGGGGWDLIAGASFREVAIEQLRFLVSPSLPLSLSLPLCFVPCPRLDNVRRGRDSREVLMRELLRCRDWRTGNRSFAQLWVSSRGLLMDAEDKIDAAAWPE